MKYLGVLGILLIILGLIFSFNIFTHYLVFLVLGWMFLMMYLNEKYFKKSITNSKNSKFFILLILIGTFITLVIEFTGAYISPAWFYSYNFFNFKFDFWFSLGAYIFLIPATFETYQFLINSFKYKLKKTYNFKILSIIILIISLILMYLPLIWSSQYKGLPFCFFIIGFFLFSDFLSYRINKNSIILNSLYSTKYIWIIVITSLIMGIISEYTNFSPYLKLFIET
ncbi:hypothetical protein K8R47_03135 [archaeon]|nr:hypothetical protein [archaeon]